MNYPPLSEDYKEGLFQLSDLLRRAVDGTVVPFFVDSSNQRIIVGSITASGSSKFQVFPATLFLSDVSASGFNAASTANFSSDINVTKVLGATSTANFFTDVTVTGTVKANLFSGSGTSLTFTSPTVQTFLSGTGTYTTPANVKWIKVRMVGGGGGGNGSGTTPGSGGNGGNTTFGTALLVANGGGGGSGAPGTASGGQINITGSKGESSNNQASFGEAGPIGGSSALGGSGAGDFQAAGGNAAANSGSGGGGAGANSTTGGTGAAGSAGGYCEAIIVTPNATYAYAVGAGGAGGTAGTGGYAGGAGAAGLIHVEEHYT